MAKRPTMDDPAIRSALLGAGAAWHPSAFLLQEMQIAGFRSYIDVAAIDDDLHAYEIKSDVDSFERLSSQMSHYDSVCDYSVLVTTSRHAAKAQGVLADHWGVVVASQTPNGVEFSIERAAQRNPLRSTTKLLEILTRPELASSLKANGFSSSAIKPLYKLDAVDTLQSFLGDDASKKIALNILRMRRTWTCRQLGVTTDDERIAHALRQGNPFICFTTNQMW